MAPDILDSLNLTFVTQIKTTQNYIVYFKHWTSLRKICFPQWLLHRFLFKNVKKKRNLFLLGFWISPYRLWNFKKFSKWFLSSLSSFLSSFPSSLSLFPPSLLPFFLSFSFFLKHSCELSPLLFGKLFSSSASEHHALSGSMAFHIISLQRPWHSTACFLFTCHLVVH